MAELPNGTVTFLFTDLERSTRLWDEQPDAMRAALARHDELVRAAIEGNGGVVVKTSGDGFHAAFPTADGALVAAVAAQRALTAQQWPDTGPLRVRMGLHTGTAELREGDYYGGTLNRAARLMAVANGGQVVCSEATADLVRDVLPSEVKLVDLGEHRLRDLSRPEHVFQVAAPDLEAMFGPLLSLDAFPGNLPLQLTSFVGRDDDRARVVEALSHTRVVTLTGIGGVGKTRLALEVAADVLPDTRHGAWLCELAPVRASDAVVDAVASVFDVVAHAGEPLEHALVEFLRHKHLVIVLDNCEHVLDEAGELVEAIERSCPEVRVLATSREGLGIPGERILAVPSLSAPRPGLPVGEIARADAVRLFEERAQAWKADFAVTADNADAVAQVCRRLDGVPLAIELAAARVPSMNPRELAERLDRRFDLLTGGRRGRVERHQTLRAVIDWSYDLLDDAEQQLLMRMTVFNGGWTLAAAEEVCSGGIVERELVYALTERLVARSLVLAEDYGSNTRFRLLETIRQYGEERLGAAGDVVALRRRHADYYVALASELAPQVFGPDQIAYGNQLFAENENFLAAIAYAIDNGDVDGAFRWFRTMPGPSSQLGRIQRLPTDAMLAMAGAHDHPDYQFGVAMAAVFEGQRGDRPASRRHMEEAREISRRRGVPLDGDIEGMLAASEITHAMAMGAWSEAAAMSERNTDSLRGRARPGQIANALGGTAALHATAGNTEHAAALASEGLALAREVGMPTAIAMNLAALASALADREPTRARMLLRESIDVRARLGYETANELSEGVLASARIRDWPMAFELAARAAPLIAWNNDRPQLAGVLNVVARAVADDDPEAAAVLHGASRRLALASIPAASAAAPAAGSATGAAGPPPGGGLIADLRREATTIIDRRIGADRRRVLRDEGERLDDEQAVAYVLEVVARASAAGAG